ncbi:MAG TPA: divalent-cation tolerance protein CutA [Acidimicrobiales bacterium]|nr:divalent-cation tolerance protein CutA [Acidimicrobiales bacterium]
MGDGHVQVQTAAASREEADAIADAVLVARVAACVQVVGPVHSRYWWQGALESAEEWLCVVKTTAERAGDAMAVIAGVHSYDNPEIIALPIVAGAGPYLAWLDTEVAR